MVSRPVIGISTADQRSVEFQRVKRSQQKTADDEENIRLLQQAEEAGVKSFPGIGGARDVAESNRIIQAAIDREKRLQQYPEAYAQRKAATATPGASALTGIRIFGAVTDPLGNLFAESGAQVGEELGGTAGAIAGGLIGGALGPVPRIRPSGIRPGAGPAPFEHGVFSGAARESLEALPGGEAAANALSTAGRAVGRTAQEAGRGAAATGKGLLSTKDRAAQKGVFSDRQFTTKLRDILKVARPARAGTEILKSEELSRRARAVARALKQETARGIQEDDTPRGVLQRTVASGRKEQAGELPSAEFQLPETLGWTVDDTFEMQNAIVGADAGHFGGPLGQIDFLATMLDVLGGRLPTRGEIQKIARFMGDDVASQFRRFETRGEKAWRLAMETAGIPRTLMVGLGWDFFRAARPVLTPVILNPRSEQSALRLRAIKKAFSNTFKAAGSEESANKMYLDMLNDPVTQLAMRHQLDVLAPGSKIASFSGANRTEGFLSNILDRVPVVGPSLRFSERINATALNTLRVETWKAQYKSWSELDAIRAVNPKAGEDFINVPGMRKIKPGEKLVNKTNLESMARYLNAATGRGNLPGVLKRHASTLNFLMFSPRFTYRQFELPFHLLSRSPAVRRAAARDLTGFVMTGIGALAVAKAAGLDVELDPRSSDFGRIRDKSLRTDLWGGFRPLAVLIGRMAANPGDPFTGEVKSSGSGQISDESIKDLLLQYMRAKTSPQAGLAIDIATGETVVGEEVLPTRASVASQAQQRLLPLVIQDIRDALENEGITHAGVASLQLIGLDSTDYLTQREIVSPYLETRYNITGADGLRITDFADSRLSQAQRSQILADPVIQQDLKRIKTQRKSDNLQIVRAAARKRREISDARLERGEKSGRQWRNDLLLSRLISAAQSNTRQSLEGPFNRKPRNENEKALQDYYAIAELHTLDSESVAGLDPSQISQLSPADRLALERAFDVEGFVQDTDQYLASLSDVQREYVINNIHPDRTSTESMYYESQKLLRRYWEIPDRVITNPRMKALYEQYVSLPANLQSAFIDQNPQLGIYADRIAFQRERLRQTNRQVDDALVLFYDLVPANQSNIAESNYGRRTQRVRTRVVGKAPKRLAEALGIEIV